MVTKHKNLHVGIACSAAIENSFDLANLFHEFGITASLYLSRARAARLAGQQEGIEDRFRELNLLPATGRLRLLSYPRLRDPRSLAVVRQAIAHMHDDGIDLLHVIIGPGEFWLAMMALLLRDRPVVTAFQQPEQNVGEDRPGWFEFATNRVAAWGSDMSVVHGQDLLHTLQRRYRLPAARTAYVPLAPRTTTVRWPSSNHPEEPGTVLFFGGARPHKGLDYLVRAQPLVSREVPQARFLIAAHGPDLERCLALVEDPARFEVHPGFVPAALMPSFFERSSLVALPYISAAASGVLLDAYSYGKPVVATRVGALPDYVVDGVTGLLVPPADEIALARAISTLLGDDDLRRRMGDNARAWVTELKQATAAQWLQVCDRALAAHGLPSDFQSRLLQEKKTHV